MIVKEDAAFAEFSLTEGDIAVPVEIVLPDREKEMHITVYDAFFSEAEAFVSGFSEDPFSDAAVAFWKHRLTAPMHVYGFTPSSDDNRIQTFTLASGGKVNLSLVQENTRLISGQDDLSLYQNRTTHELMLGEGDPEDIAAIAVCDKEIVAYAVINDCVEEADTIEISVECALGYRGQGLASSCVALLTDALLRRGLTVLYKCRLHNDASAKVAQKVGFQKSDIRYSFVCYRD